jgi:adenine-specific DNA-methyltransferase
VKLIEYLLGITMGANDLILDFFGGSGTTVEAVMAANDKDSGQRRCLLVTNNELPKSDAARLKKSGVLAGDDEWESYGVFQKVALPRIRSAATGEHPNGDVFSEGYSENVEFFEITYEDRDLVSLGVAFEAIAPLLWMRAGAVGPRIDKRKGSWALPDKARYGVLFDPAGWRDFVNAVNASDIVSHAFIVTDSNSVFQQVVRELSPSVEPVRLYENYLDSFEINTGGI